MVNHQFPRPVFVQDVTDFITNCYISSHSDYHIDIALIFLNVVIIKVFLKSVSDILEELLKDYLSKINNSEVD